METIETTELGATIFYLFLEWTKTLDEMGRGSEGDEELVEFYSRVMGESPNGAGALSYRAFIGGIKTGIQYAEKAQKVEERKEIDLSWIDNISQEQPIGA